VQINQGFQRRSFPPGTVLTFRASAARGHYDAMDRRCPSAFSRSSDRGHVVADASHGGRFRRPAARLRVTASPPRAAAAQNQTATRRPFLFVPIGRAWLLGKRFACSTSEVIQNRTATPMTHHCVALFSAFWLGIATAAAQTPVAVHTPTAAKATQTTWRCRHKVRDCRYKTFRTSLPMARPLLMLGIAN